MNLHEYQAKTLLAQYGLPVERFIVARSGTEAAQAFDRLGGTAAVVKAQIHAGGRGKAGGVKTVGSRDEAQAAAETMLGSRLVTYQTDAHGQPVNCVMVSENVYPPARELYLGMTIDRKRRRVAVMASTEGGMEIEKVAAEMPEKLFKITVDPLIGLMPCHARELAFKLGLTGEQTGSFVKLLLAAYRAFTENDFSLLEVNPLALLSDGRLMCLDSKIGLDGNALFRHPDILALRDTAQEHPRETAASELGLSYVALDGDIGCMVNGAGLAMATMDIIKLYGGSPANFLDVGGSATTARVTEAFKLILTDTSVKGILINIFGGIVRCDMIAEAIVAAVKEMSVNVPVVVRLEGNKAEEGTRILEQSGLRLVSAQGLADAAQKIVAAVKGAEQ